jgi:hypothetical protein
LRLWRVIRGAVYNPLGKLVWVARALSLADGHGNHDATGRMLKRDLWIFKLTHYPLVWSRELEIHGDGNPSRPVGMKEHTRELEFTEMRPDRTMTARCAARKRQFRAIPKIGEKADGTVMSIRTEFDAHNCNREALPGS